VYNAVTFDVEDWRQLVRWKTTGVSSPPEATVVRETDAILTVLADRGVKATFFVLANVASTHPALVRRIHAAGHEIASHGLSHRLVHTQTASEFRDETRRAKEILEDVVGEQVLGYRAAEFSLPEAGPAAVEILAETGFRYDSSTDPARGRRGETASAPGLVDTPSGSIVEFPVLSADRGVLRRVGGGGSYHVLPTRIVLDAIRGANGHGRPAVVYLHPYDLPGDRLTVSRPRTLSATITYWRHALVHNAGRERVGRTLAAILDSFEFRTLRELATAVVR
jgi:polysaccharide deacetylase family protein (PEP-CTERM system associated)